MVRWRATSARLRERYSIAVTLVALSAALYLLFSVVVGSYTGGEDLLQRRGAGGSEAPSVTAGVKTLRSTIGYSLQDIACGVHNTITQRPYDHFFPFQNLNMSMPLYATHNINLLKRFNVGERYRAEDAPMESDNIFNNKIKNVIIVQHGNLRNGNDYYCYAVNTFLDNVRKRFGIVSDASSDISSLTHSEQIQEVIDSTLIIVPQILTHGDICFGLGNEVFNVDLSAQSNCGQSSQFVWSSEGWKDGHLSLTRPENNRTSSDSLVDDKKAGSGLPIIPITPHTEVQILVRGAQLYSYDLYNILIRHFANSEIFPAVANITLFGFSAGAQTLLRYSVLPIFLPILSATVLVQYVISDPSTFLYFDSRRPLPLSRSANISTILAQSRGSWIGHVGDLFAEVSFREPSEYDLPASWREDANRTRWISDWTADKCADYNKWRYGFDDLQGYYEHHRSRLDASVQQFDARRVHFLVGLRDDVNCRLGQGHAPGTCDDDELATHCAAMLQGINRVDRFLKYYKYLDTYYSDSSRVSGRKLYLIENCPHDPLAMMQSQEARCLLFGCP